MNAPQTALVKELVYDSELTPDKNISNFFEYFFSLSYRILKGPDGEKFLSCAWHDYNWLKDQVCPNFQKDLYDAVLEKSDFAEKGGEYLSLLKSLISKMSAIKGTYDNAVRNVLVVDETTGLAGPKSKLPFSALEEPWQIEIENTYNLLRIFSGTLYEMLSEERVYFTGLAQTFHNSKYRWTTDKIAISELVFALVNSGWIDSQADKKLMPNALARDIAALFGVESLNYRFDVRSFGRRSNEAPRKTHLEQLTDNFIKSSQTIG